MEAIDGEEVRRFADAAGWESWLAHHHDRRSGVWLKIATKGSGERSVTLDEALDVALCYGWIDSKRKSLDANHYLQRYSPRRRGSSWSRINIERAQKLIAAKRIREPGLAAFRAARSGL